jgi:alpha-1,6-mannosyltransferase
MTCACLLPPSRCVQTAMKRSTTAILLLGSGMTLCCALLLRLGNFREQIISCIGVFCAACALYWVLLVILRVFSIGSPAAPPAGFQRDVYAIVACALLFRLILLFSPPSLSDDIYRYVWEGRLVAAGLNPFSHAPDDPKLAHLRDAFVHPQINHREFSTIYPPLSLGLFGLTAHLSPTVRAMNTTFLVFDVLTMLVLLQTLRAMKLDPRRVAVYAWNPLVLLEFAGSGHVDSAGIFFLMLALYMSLKSQAIGATLALACGFLCKFLPILFVFFMNFRRTQAAALGIAVTALVFYSLFLDARGNLVQSLAVYGRTWSFNASLYELVHLVVSDAGYARLMCGILCAALLILLWRKRADLRATHGLRAPYAIGLMLLGALIALSPVVHPWYVCWLVPFAAIRPSRAAVLLSGTVFLSYLVLRGYAAEGIWQEHPAVQFAVYLPVYCVLAAEVLAACRRRVVNPVPAA